MNGYAVDSRKEGIHIVYTIRRRGDGRAVQEANQFLFHKMRENCSPNTVKRFAFSISYYLSYLEEKNLDIGTVFGMAYDRQQIHFTDFLYWLKEGKHVQQSQSNGPNPATCNLYLKDVFGWYQFLEIQNEPFRQLKVLSSRTVTYTNSLGIKSQVTRRTFRGYLPEDEHIGRTIEQDQILTLLLGCTNVRDQLLLLLLAETGFRIGEMLGIRYTHDIDYENRTMYVRFRENRNRARAKNAEYRRAKLSQETFDVLQFYLAEYRNLLKKTEYLFVILTGNEAGSALKVSTVYAMLRRLEGKTGIKATPHMLRHYFANERRKDGWDLFLISKALGHRQVATTEKYLDIGTDELAKAAEEYYKKHKSLLMAEQLV